MNHVLEWERKGCFDFFWNEVSLQAPSYGLILDNDVDKNMASIASVGFGLAAIVIGVERGYISREQGEERAVRTLATMLSCEAHNHGFFRHFLRMDDGKQYSRCEISIIDTALFLMGALTAGEYFGGHTSEYAQKLYERVDWTWYLNPVTNQFYMGYNEPAGGMFGAWDCYAEQFIMYFLAAASPTHPVSPSVFYDCPLHRGQYGQWKDIIHSHCGSLFVYQFSHAFLDLRGKKDRRGIDWFENSIKATMANRQYCIDMSEKYHTFHENAWGLTACTTPSGYSGAQGTPPNHNNNTHQIDGTVPPCGALGSIVFTPEVSIAAAEYYYHQVPLLKGSYGFLDSYNLDADQPFYADRVIGIDKGITIVMIENYETGLIWNVLKQNKALQKAFELLEFQG